MFIKIIIITILLMFWFSIVLNKERRCVVFNAIKAMPYGPVTGLIAMFIMFGIPILVVLCLVI